MFKTRFNNIGNSNTMKDGDMPREFDILFGPPEGAAYYKSCTESECTGCGNKTNMWYVTIKSKGKFLCKECKNKRFNKI